MYRVCTPLSTRMPMPPGERYPASFPGQRNAGNWVEAHIEKLSINIHLEFRLTRRRPLGGHRLGSRQNFFLEFTPQKFGSNIGVQGIRNQIFFFLQDAHPLGFFFQVIELGFD